MFGNIGKSKGFAQIPLILGLVIMAVAIPVATRLSQQSADNRGSAREQLACRYCAVISGKNKCLTRGGGCSTDLNECTTDSNCVPRSGDPTNPPPRQDCNCDAAPNYCNGDKFDDSCGQNDYCTGTKTDGFCAPPTAVPNTPTPAPPSCNATSFGRECSVSGWYCNGDYVSGSNNNARWCTQSAPPTAVPTMPWCDLDIGGFESCPSGWYCTGDLVIGGYGQRYCTRNAPTVRPTRAPTAVPTANPNTYVQCNAPASCGGASSVYGADPGCTTQNPVRLGKCKYIGALNIWVDGVCCAPNSGVKVTPLPGKPCVHFGNLLNSGETKCFNALGGVASQKIECTDGDTKVLGNYLVADCKPAPTASASVVDKLLSELLGHAVNLAQQKISGLGSDECFGTCDGTGAKKCAAVIDPTKLSIDRTVLANSLSRIILNGGGRLSVVANLSVTGGGTVSNCSSCRNEQRAVTIPVATALYSWLGIDLTVNLPIAKGQCDSWIDKVTEITAKLTAEAIGHATNLAQQKINGLGSDECFGTCTSNNSKRCDAVPGRLSLDNAALANSVRNYILNGFSGKIVIPVSMASSGLGGTVGNCSSCTSTTRDMALPAKLVSFLGKNFNIEVVLKMPIAKGQCDSWLGTPKPTVKSPTATPTKKLALTPTVAGCKQNGLKVSSMAECCSKHAIYLVGNGLTCATAPTATPTKSGCKQNGTYVSSAYECCSDYVENEYYAQGVIRKRCAAMPTATPTKKLTSTPTAVPTKRLTATPTKKLTATPTKTGCKQNGLQVSSSSECCSGYAAYYGSSGLTCGVAPTATPTPTIGGPGGCNSSQTGIVNTFGCAGQITQSIATMYRCSRVVGSQCVAGQLTKLKRNADCSCEIVCEASSSCPVATPTSEPTKKLTATPTKIGCKQNGIQVSSSSECCSGYAAYYGSSGLTCGVAPTATPTPISGGPTNPPTGCQGSKPSDKCEAKKLSVNAACVSGAWDYDEQLCNSKGRKSVCGGTNYCCDGNSWTTNMSACSQVTQPPQACKQCPTDFKCYEYTKQDNSKEYRWFVTGYVMQGFVSSTNATCNGVAKPLYLGKAKGDATCDGRIDSYDYTVWRKEYIDISHAAPVTRDNWEADFTGNGGVCDGVVDSNDYAQWRKEYINSQGGNK